MPKGLVISLRTYASLSHAASPHGFSAEGYTMARAADLIEELVGLLREALEELDDYYHAEYDTDHPYHKDKLAAARDSWAHARDILARIK